nr:MAG TPA: hypothetical protein [Caudoviricetes sp.]
MGKGPSDLYPHLFFCKYYLESYIITMNQVYIILKERN